MNLHLALAKALEELGARTLFGLLGDANLFLGDSYARETGGSYVAAAHEAGAVLMANGYAITSGEVGVATVSHGPGFSNTVTPLIEGVRNRTPMVLIAGDTDLEDEGNLQDVHQEGLVAATGAGFVQVRTAEMGVRALRTSFHRAVVEQRPIVLNVPRSFQLEDVPYLATNPVTVASASETFDASSLDSVAGLIAWANRPIILAGHGAIGSASRQALISLGQLLGAPLATTLKAKDLFKGERLDLGLFGTLSSDTTVDAIAAADCVIAFGASLNRYTTDRGALLKGKRVVQCDVNAAAIGALANLEEGICGDAAAVAQAIGEVLQTAGVEPSSYYSEMAARAQPEQSVDRVESAAGTVDIRDALVRLEGLVPEKRLLAVDVGRFMFETLKILSVPEPRSYVHSASLASIGLAVGNGVGACFGQPDRPCLVVVGDGGFMLGGLAEFNTAVRYGLKLITVVMNDGSYGAEHVQLRRRDMSAEIMEMGWPELAPLAEALGGRGVTIRNLVDFDPLEHAIKELDGPLLVDVKLDPEVVPIP
jgi:acetolactate synthase I/II/III large subunit